MRRTFASIGLLLYLLSSSAPVFAQSADIAQPEVGTVLTPVIAGPEDIAVGRTLVLDASSSRGLGTDTVYRWYIEGVTLPISRTVEFVYTPERAGAVTVRLEVQTTINEETITAEVERLIIIYERKIAIIADTSVQPDKLALHRETAAEQGVYLTTIQPTGTALPVSMEETLFTVIADQSAALDGAEAIVLWTDGIVGLQALMRVSERDPEHLQNLANQTIVVISDRGLQTLARTAIGPFSVLEPKQILITRKEAINPLILSSTVDEFLIELEQRDIDMLIVDESSTKIRPWNLLGSLVNYMLTHGVSSQIIILLLILPVIATILAFFKQVIGITTFGLYTPSIVALSFLALGWAVGLAFLVFILTTGYITRSLMRRWRLLYVPKVAIILTVVSITLLLLLGLGASFDITFGRDTIFILLIMSTLAESFLTVKAEEGWYGAMMGIGETILAALICVWIVSWAPLQSVILAYPELILFTIAINAFLGKWTGLRLVEYFRFREVFKHLQEE